MCVSAARRALCAHGRGLTHTHTHREFMRRVTAARVRETNSKCEVSHEVKGDETPPTVQVKFSKSLMTMWCIVCALLCAADGSELVFEGSSHKALDIIAAINSKSRKL